MLELAEARGVGVETSERIGDLEICRGKVCLEFGAGRSPRFRRLDAEYSIIASRLRSGAVEVIIDGDKAQITEALGKPIH